MVKTANTLRLLILDILAEYPDGVPLSKLITLINQRRAVERQTIQCTLFVMVKNQEVLRLDDARCSDCNHLVARYQLSRRMRSQLKLNGELK